MTTRYTTTRPEDWKEVAEKILQELPERDGATTLALRGTLGAGKTTFVQALADALGVEHKVSSPTFVLMSRYETSDEHFKTLIHVDAYRIEDESEADILQLDTYATDTHTLICIEWPEHIPSHIPEGSVDVVIGIEGDGRIVTVTA